MRMFKVTALLAVLATVLVVSEAMVLAVDEEVPFGEDGVDDYPSPVLAPAPDSYPFAPRYLEPTRPVEGDTLGLPLGSRARRSTVVFRPLFATRERDAERMAARERRREYWANEERRRSAQAAYPAYSTYPAYGAYPGQQYYGR